MDKTINHRIKELLSEWNRFPANAEADLDCLCSEVLTALGEGLGSNDLASVIHNEFMNHVGHSGPAEDVQQISEVLVDWWANRQGAA